MQRRHVLALMLPALLPSGVRVSVANAGDDISVVTLNLWHDKADWPARQRIISATLRTLRPDVIVLQEVLQHAKLANQAMTLAQTLGYAYRFASLDAEGAERRYGNAVLTRHRILADGWAALAPHDDYRSALHVRIGIGQHSVDVYATHLHYQPAGAAVRRQQVEGLLTFVAQTRSSEAVIVAGDFNAPADAPEFVAMTAAFDDAYDTVHPEAAQTAFEHSTLNPFLLPALRVDHVWFARSRFRAMSAMRLFDHPGDDGTWASDHFGIHAVLRRG